MKDPLTVLQSIREIRPRPRLRAGERCDLCSTEIPDEHGHLVDLEARVLLCSCRACYLLFLTQGAGGRRYRAVPERYLALEGFSLSAPEWEALQIPVGVAFFFHNSDLGRVAAFYPGPAGATESLLPLETWDELTSSHPELKSMEPDVEALLVRAELRRGAVEGHIVPIDICYELVGRLRLLWRGFDGGSEAHEAIETIFAEVRSNVDRRRR